MSNLGTPGLTDRQLLGSEALKLSLFLIIIALARSHHLFGVSFFFFFFKTASHVSQAGLTPAV